MKKKKLKVLRVIARLNVGGPAIHTILLTQSLNNDYFESMLVTGSVAPGEKDMSYLASEKGVSPVIIPQFGRQINPLKDIVALWKIYRIIRSFRPDIVHTHTAKAGALGRIAAILAGTPVRIHTFHGHIFDGYFSGFYIFIFLLIERVLALWTRYIVVVSRAQKREIGKRYRITSPDKIKVIQLGLELEKFFSVQPKEGELRRSAGIADDAVTVGIVGRLVPVKNHGMFLEAAKRLNVLTEGKAKVKYLIIGDGEERMRLEERADKLGIREDVVFRGWRENMAEVYSDIDILALTSLNEGTPVAVIEALASARPVVVTNVGGVTDVVDDGVHGYVVASGDAPAFADRLFDLVNDPAKRALFGERGREMVRQKFSIERLVRDITELYEEAV